MEVEGKEVKTERKRECTKNIPSHASPNVHDNTEGKASLSLPPTPRRTHASSKKKIIDSRIFENSFLSTFHLEPLAYQTGSLASRVSNLSVYFLSPHPQTPYKHPSPNPLLI